MKKMLKTAAVLAAILMAFTLGACSDDDGSGSGSGGGGETFKKFDVPANTYDTYYVNKAGDISAEKKDGYDFKVTIFENELNPYTCYLDEYTGSDSSLSIPEGITRIGSRAFNGCEELTSVILPKGIDSLSDSAFYNCAALTTVEFKGVIVDGAYKGYIYGQAFMYCDKLVTVKYAGTKEQWKSIECGGDRFIGSICCYTEDDYSGEKLIVECKDGKIRWNSLKNAWVDAD